MVPECNPGSKPVKSIPPLPRLQFLPQVPALGFLKDNFEAKQVLSSSSCFWLVYHGNRKQIKPDGDLFPAFSFTIISQSACPQACSPHGHKMAATGALI